MAFLGGIPGLGALAGGVEQGIGQGFNIDQYLNSIQSQNLAGNILSQAYGGQGGQGSSSPLSGLGNIVGGSAGSGGPGMGAAVSPTTPSGAGGTGPSVGNLFTPNPSQALPPGQPAVGAGLGNLAQGQQAQAQPQPQAQPQAPPLQSMPQQQFNLSQPFQTNQSQGLGAQNQLTLPQFVQMARRVNPNASGRQIMLAAGELAKGGLLGYGAMSPYQAAQLARQQGLTDAEIANIKSEIDNRTDEARARAATDARDREREADTRAKAGIGELDRGVNEAQTRFAEATTALNQNAERQGQVRSEISNLVSMGATTPDAKAALNDANSRLATLQGEETDLTAAQAQAKKDRDAAVQQRAEGAAKSYGGGGSGTEDDPVKVSTPSDAERLPPGTIYQTPDGQTMVR